MSRWLDAYYRLCIKHKVILTKCGCGQSHIQVYSAERDEIDGYFNYYRRFWGKPKKMKTYKFRKRAFEHAQKRVKDEGGEMMVVFNKRHDDMVVRRNLGQKLKDDQVLVATCSRVPVQDGMGRVTEKIVVTEAKHGLKIPLNRREARKCKSSS